MSSAWDACRRNREGRHTFLCKDKSKSFRSVLCYSADIPREPTAEENKWEWNGVYKNSRRRIKKDEVKSGILNAKIMATYRKCKKRAWTQPGKESDNELLC